METANKVFITFLALVLVVVLLYFFTNWFSKTTGYAVGENEKIKIAQCLSGKGAKMLGTLSCGDCIQEKDLFGEAFKFLNFIDCGQPNSGCANIENNLAWQINGTIYYGFRNLTELQNLSGCQD